jgi:hypothetical protein
MGSHRPQRSERLAWLVLAGLLASASGARADRVVLKSGAVLEGSATLDGERVVVALESGAITLARSEVARVERERPPMEVVAERRARLGAADVAGRVALARYCRAHELAQTERELWLEVLALAPEQPEARARLGQVRTKDGWVDATAVARERRSAREADGRAAREARARAELELDRARLERDRAALALEQQRRRDERPTASYAPTQTTLWFPSVGYARTPAPFGPHTPAAPAAAPFDINGVRSPHDMGFALPGVRDPRSYFGP